ncbi:MAG: DUF302 domain-containing protein [Vulcanimicrobiota bacterium]
MIIKISTEKTVGETAEALQLAVEANHFGVLHVHDLKQTLNKKGVEFTRQCLIFEVCQPQQAKSVLEKDMSLSTALPCRISIYDDGGRTVMASLKPTMLLGMFKTLQLDGVAQQVEDSLVKIMEQASGSVARAVKP